MKFTFKVSKLANQFFFISNLAEWHFSCRPDYNETWLKETGALTTKEKSSLDAFRKVILKHGFKQPKGPKGYLGTPFLIPAASDVAWKKVRAILTSREAEIVQATFQIFEPRFRKLWNASELNRRAERFQRFIGQKRYRNLFADIEYFLKDRNRTYAVVVLASPRRGEGVSAAGGANIGDAHVTFELPQLRSNSWEAEYSVGVLAHEVAHILYKKRGVGKMIVPALRRARMPEYMPVHTQPRLLMRSFMNELITELLVPFGYLAQKHYRFKPTNLHFSRGNLRVLGEEFEKYLRGKTVSVYKLRKFLVWQLFPVAASYLENGRKFGRQFVEVLTGFAEQTLKFAKAANKNEYPS